MKDSSHIFCELYSFLFSFHLEFLKEIRLDIFMSKCFSIKNIFYEINKVFYLLIDKLTFLIRFLLYFYIASTKNIKRDIFNTVFIKENPLNGSLIINNSTAKQNILSPAPTKDLIHYIAHLKEVTVTNIEFSILRQNH